MKDRINKHPCLLALASSLLIIFAFISSTVVAGINDRSSNIDLMPAPQNYIRLPNVGTGGNLPDTIQTEKHRSGATTSPWTGATSWERGKVPVATESWFGNVGGNLMYKGEVNEAIAGKVVVIDNITDLTTLSGVSPRPQTDSGASIFWMEWGRHYKVDPWKIGASFAGGVTGPHVSGSTGIKIFTEVSGIFRPVLKNDDNKTITIEVISTGSTGWYSSISGATPVTLWAPLNSGATSYSANSHVTAIARGDLSGTTYQTLLVMYKAAAGYGSGTTGVFDMPWTVTSLSSGGSDWELNRMGEWKTYRAQYGSGLSVIPIRKNVFVFPNGN